MLGLDYLLYSSTSAQIDRHSGSNITGKDANSIDELFGFKTEIGRVIYSSCMLVASIVKKAGRWRRISDMHKYTYSWLAGLNDVNAISAA